MMQRLVDHALAITKESVKAFTYESLNNVVRLINGVSALLLAVLPGKTTILEGIHGWELRPTFRGPWFPRWMENGYSSFNQFILELSEDSGTSSSEDYISGEEDNLSSSSSFSQTSSFATPLSSSSSLSRTSSFATPLSSSSSFSRTSSFIKYDRHQMRWIKCLLSWMLWPTIFILGIPFRICYFAGFWKLGAASVSSEDHQSSCLPSSNKSNLIEDHMVPCTTDRRRGVVEDLQLAIEIFIEAVFDIVHTGAHYLLSPSEACCMLFRWVSSHGNKNKKDSDADVSVLMATLGDVAPSPKEREMTFHHRLNTDERTCRDVITELGYPFEAIRVVTSDGYVLHLERIPRRDSKKVVYLQHGILDSSMGYWRYSINEHGTQDMPAVIEKIHQIKTSELKSSQSDLDDETEEQPYKLCAICHSLGGAVMLMYIITRRLENKLHRLSRLILLSPAGFHEDGTLAFTVAEYVVLMMAPILVHLVPAIYIPTRFFRMLLNKLARDFHNYPALGGLVQTLMSYAVGGDSSNWVGAIGMPHYNMNNMPGISFRVAHHLMQMKHARKFIMYDFGSATANMEAYGSPDPLDLGQHYGLIDVPVDLVAGRKDRVIPPSMVRKHYELMKNEGVEASYNEYEYAHLEFTFSHREEVLAYVMSRLLLVIPPLK
ncbi:uncharacterized protein LOC131234995 isoform X2 [Magnolia sinica]|uniref:uncharacterized protein LOC131234995 isoform X2 n=1 Tax=Magnolia sinica TaxID=86752 RepID=UPI002658080B|nr:uncharacterized protein LOC131234995 isoform X2 [Magnolia sinica]